jgi:hypothetical protein
MDKRALRRHHKARKRAYAFRCFSIHAFATAEWAREAAMRRAENMQVCSRCCGNRRKYEGPTLQERRHFEATSG